MIKPKTNIKIDSIEFKNIQNELKTNFDYFCTLSLISDNETPQRRYNNVKKHKYYEGLDENTKFCVFKPNLPKEQGIYLWIINKEIVYIGESENLYHRFNNQYGVINPRNPFSPGGQPTNCRLNSFVHKAYQQNQKIDIYIYKTEGFSVGDRKNLEFQLRIRIKTKLNRQLL